MGSRIAIIGTGYVGLTTGACFAHIGHDVVCADIDPTRIERLSRGILPIFEPGLQEIVEAEIASGRLSFVVGAAEAAKGCEFAYLCVQTPQGEDGAADLTYLQAAAAEIAHVLLPNSIVVNKSTVPVGSTKVVERVLGRHDVAVVSNPEFLREGSAVNDFLHPDRVVIGSDDPSAATRVSELYDATSGHVIITDPASAETIKYAANAFLATKISFVNAVAAVCEAVGADVNDVVLGLGYDKRIGHEFLRPGPGWGGSCFDGTETVLLRARGEIELIPFRDLDAFWDRADGLPVEALSWSPDGMRPEFERVTAVTSRPYVGEMIDVRTKMGRRLTVTADHPMIARLHGEESRVVLAGELTDAHWLPVSVGDPLHEQLAADWMGDVALDEDAWQAIGADVINTHCARIPDLAWSATEDERRALLRGLWLGDGSWSFIAGGPSVVLEYGTVSRELADGMLRLLGTLGIVARLKVGRTTKSTVDTYWLCISGADQVSDAVWLVPECDRPAILESIGRQAKRIAPTGYRMDGKGTAWVRVVEVARRDVDQQVYSLEVDRNHTVVTSYGLVAHNCFPKDTRAMVKIAEDAGYDFNLLKGVVVVNDEQRERMIAKVERAVGGDLKGALVAAWGLTFKANTDDLRESPAIAIITELLERGATVKAYDPQVKSHATIEVGSDPYEICEGADALVVLTEWDAFRWFDLEQVKGLLAKANIVDTRNLLDRAAALRLGFTYQGVGR